MSPQLLVADIERSIEFYTTKLNFEIDFRYEDFYAGIKKDGFSIHLKSYEQSTEGRRKGNSGENLEIVFSVENIEDLFDEYSLKSVGITQALRDMPYGKDFYVSDPDGNIIAFVEETRST